MMNSKIAITSSSSLNQPPIPTLSEIKNKTNDNSNISTIDSNKSVTLETNQSTITQQSNLAQLILKQKETQNYKKISHPKAFFIKQEQENINLKEKKNQRKTLITATSSQIIRSPTDYQFPPFSFNQEDKMNNNNNNNNGNLIEQNMITNPIKKTSLFPTTISKNQILSDPDTQAQLAWLGYHQELRRDWDFWSSLSLSTLNIGTIPGAFLGILTALEWGGPCVIFWGYIMGMIIVLCLSAVVAEIASAYPVAGAMLSWTFKLARANPKIRDWARFISWVVGTLLFVAHVVVQVALTSQCTMMVFSLIHRFYPSWSIETGWQAFLLNAGHLITCGLLLCTAPIRSPRLWKILGGISILLYLIICIALIVGSRSSGHHYYGGKEFLKLIVTFHNNTTFKDNGFLVDAFVFLMGTSLVSLAFGAEASAHLAEETRTPASSVPKALFASTLVSYVLGLVLNMCLMSALLPLTPRESQHKLHLIDLIFTHCTPPLATTILICLLLLMFFQDIAQLFAASRFTWALARDNAFPGSKIWRKVSGSWMSIFKNQVDEKNASTRRIPRMSIVLLISCSLATTATVDFKQGIVSDSLLTSATYLLVFCYLTPLLIYLSCDPDVLEYDGRNVWRIPSLSRACTWISVISLIVVLLLMACPHGLPITLESWSWSPLITLVFTSASSIGWLTYGSKRYIGPIKSITFWTTGQEVDFPRTARFEHNLINKTADDDDNNNNSPRNLGVFQNHFPVLSHTTNSSLHLSNTSSHHHPGLVNPDLSSLWPITITKTTVTEFCSVSSVLNPDVNS